MGTPQYADEILKTLILAEDIEVVAVFTQPDRPVGRNQQLTLPLVKETALAYNLKCFQPHSLKKEDYTTTIAELNPDFIIVAAFGQILPASILVLAPCINLHASILPRFRGASPIQQALVTGEHVTGVTAMLMNEGMDTGDIITYKEMTIPDEMLADELFDALTVMACNVTLEVIRHFNDYTITPQDNSKATYCTKISKADGLVTFDDARMIYRKYRAFTPWPGIYTQSGLKLLKVALASQEGTHKPGIILHCDAQKIEIGCARGSLYIYSLQPPSKKPMDAKSYLNGKRLMCADYLA